MTETKIKQNDGSKIKSETSRKTYWYVHIRIGLNMNMLKKTLFY